MLVSNGGDIPDFMQCFLEKECPFGFKALTKEELGQG